MIELKTTLFKTPIISTVLRALSLLVMKLIGWRIAGVRPKDAKYVMIAVPHTSNWDFILMMMAAFILRFEIHWMGKDSLFVTPIKWLMLWLGGIPIDRSQRNDVVTQMVDYFANAERLTVIIPPEGHRQSVGRWKTGFYHIAYQAKVPIYLGFIDASSKSIGFGPRFDPSGDIEQDMVKIQAFYRHKQGVVADNFQL